MAKIVNKKEKSKQQANENNSFANPTLQYHYLFIKYNTLKKREDTRLTFFCYLCG